MGKRGRVFLRNYLFSFIPRRSRAIRDHDFFSTTFAKTKQVALTPHDQGFNSQRPNVFWDDLVYDYSKTHPFVHALCCRIVTWLV